MQLENMNVESLDICDLEYDVAGVGAAESSNSEVNHAAYRLICYKLPTQA